MVQTWLSRLRNYLGKRLFRVAQRVSVDSLGGPTMRATVSVVSPQLKPDELTVAPDDPYAEDLLARRPFGDGLSRLVDYGAGTGVVLIDATWGQGKTSFLRMWIQQARNDGKVVALVNAWDGDYRGNPLEYIAAELASELKSWNRGDIFSRFSNRTRQIWSYLRGLGLRVLGGGAGIAAMDGSAAWMSAIVFRELIRALENMELGHGTDERRLQSLRKKLQRAARTLRSRRTGQVSTRFVIVIDELDRCRPDYAVRFMETVKHVFEVEHITFVIAANSSELGKAMSGVYGDEFDGEAYLERFFDIRLQLPEGTRDVFVTRAVEEARLASQFGGEMPRDEFDSSIDAEKVVVELLQHSRLSLREILKTLNHLKVMLLFYRSQLGSYVLSALALATIRSVARESYESLEYKQKADGAMNLLCNEIGGMRVEGNALLEFVEDVLFWCRPNAELELSQRLERGRDENGVVYGARQTERMEYRLGRKELVNYQLVRDIIEMTARSKESS